MSSSPLRPGADLKEQLEWYKTQYAQLETDLSEFQASSKELEEQLEKDVEVAEKNERKWKEQVEKLSFEVDEWKTKHKQAKAEANSAQNALQKEITTLRESTRSLQLKLRDIEVVNDDYERQARNTESSLEDLDSKYNSALEQRVMLDEEIKIGEQERESLRIEAQRLRDELGDLKVESEITLEKLRLAGETISTLRARRPTQLAVDGLRTRSPLSEASGMTPLSPTASTPPPRSDTASEAITPPSPPLSDSPTTARMEKRTPALVRKRSIVPESTTPKPPVFGARNTAKHTRGGSITSTASTAASDARAMRPPVNRVRPSRQSHGPSETASRNESLSQIRGLIGRMQKIEERVHSARSKLPTPSNTTPRGSPRYGGYSSGDRVPSSVTLRRSSKHISISTSSSALQSEDSTAEKSPARRASHVKRLSFGIPRPPSAAGQRSEIPRPGSALGDVPPSSSISRPASRQSNVGGYRPPSRTGARTVEPGHYIGGGADYTTGTSGGGNGNIIPGRSRSSMGGNHYASVHTPARGHRTSASVSELRRKAEESATDVFEPIKRSTTALPTPNYALPRRQSGGIPRPAMTKRASFNFNHNTHNSSNHDAVAGGGGSGGSGGMPPPPPRKRISDVGETY